MSELPPSDDREPPRTPPAPPPPLRPPDPVRDNPVAAPDPPRVAPDPTRETPVVAPDTPRFAPPVAAPDPANRPRRLGEVAALVSALTAVAGLLLGFFGLPTLVNSPTARQPTVVTVTVTAPPTATATTTTTAPATSDPGTDSGTDDPGTDSPESVPAPPPLPTGTVALKDLTPLGDYGSDGIGLSTATLGGKAHPNAIVLKYPCQGPIEYGLNERYKSLSLTVGLDDNSLATPGALSIIADGKQRKSVMLEINRPQTVTVDLTGVVRLGIQSDISEGGFCNPDGVVIALAEATLRS
ncbi:NPCBM/NEW2 domain-containing protein [Streptomyces sp. NPDC033754]|uniref:NPCBM/NEW2 domain-containing protein n=1 Tax=unclassified Streptomyces TaxID=2593676 RepID=UPI0033F3F370